MERLVNTKCETMFELEVFVRLNKFFIRITVYLGIIRTVNRITDNFSLAT
jgi:hypothetical protein